MEPQASDSPSSLPFKKRARMNDTSQQQQQQASSSSSLPAMTNIIYNNTHSSNALNSLSRISPKTAAAIAALTPESVYNSTTNNNSASSRTTHNNSPTDCLEETLNPDLCIEKAFKAADEAWGSVSNKYLQSKVLFTLEDVLVMIRPAIDQMMKQELTLEKRNEPSKKKNSKKTSKTQKSQKTSKAGGTTHNISSTATVAATAAASKSTTATVPKRGKTLPNLSSVQNIQVQQQPVVATPTPITQSTYKKRTRATFDEYPYPPKSLPENIPHNLPKSLALPTDSNHINKLHQFVRSDLLEIIQEQDRIGFQCTFCKHSKNPQQLFKFFPKCLENASAGGLYRSVCTWQRVHFKACKDVPKALKKKYDLLKEDDKTRGRVQYWEDSAKLIGLWNKKGGGICFMGAAGGGGAGGGSC